jgi:hypothetical protein
MDDTNEYDEYFAPVKDKTKAVNKILAEVANAPVKKLATAVLEESNPHDNDFTTEGNSLPTKPFWTPEKTAAAVGGAGGALYGAARTPAYSPAFTEWAAKHYGIPVEDVAGYMNMRNPAPPTSREAARAIAARSSAIPATTPISNLVEEPPGGHERWLAPRSAVPVPKALSDQMVTMTGGAGTKGSGEEILARHAAGVNKVQELGYDPFTMEKKGSFYIPPEGRARPQPPQVWNRPRAVGPAPWTSPEFAVPKVPSAPVGAAPVSPLPTAAPAASEESLRAALEQNIQRAGGLANVAQRGASAGLGAFGAGMGGLQLLDALRSMRTGFRPDNALQAAEGAGFLSAMKYPKVGLPVAGTAKMARSASDMYNEGVTPERAAAMASGAGLIAMPKFPVLGALAQTPELYFALQKWRAEHPAENDYPIELH